MIKNILKIRSLRKFFILMLTAFALLSMLVTAAFFYLRTSNILTEQVRRDAATVLAQVNSSVRTEVNQVDATFPMFVANPTIRDYIEPTSAAFDSSAVQKRVDIERQMSYLLINTYLWDEKYINSVYLFDSQGETYSVLKTYAGTSVLTENLKIVEALDHAQPSLQIVPIGGDGKIIAFVRNIYSINDGSYIATIVINVNEAAFRAAYSANFSPDTLIALVDSQNQLLSSQGKSDTVRTLLATSEAAVLDSTPTLIPVQGKSWFTASEILENTNIRSYVALSRNSMYAGLNQTLQSFLPLFFVLAAAVLIVAILVSALVTRPIHTMMQRVRAISGGEDATEIPAGMYTEFNELAIALNEMLGRLNGYYQDLYEEELLLKNAQIKALRTQINPHFLFNVLDTISWKAQLSGDEEVAKLTVTLGDLLRSSVLNEDTDEVQLREELENVRFYLYLQKARFEERFEVDINIKGNALLDSIVPRLSIQPLVENAIVHGLERKAGQGHLHILAFQKDACLKLIVEDDGVGFNTTELGRKEEKQDRHTHIGVHNLNRRIALLYGKDYGLQIVSEPGHGTRAIMMLPLKFGR